MTRSCAVAAAAAAAVVFSACGRSPAPPSPLAFSIQARSPRVLEARGETAVRAVVVNTGLRAWDPARVHLSYHWLWLVPRELASRSRTLPYHDGIRTELGTFVPPRGRVAVEARLLAPTAPGIYWLQWDMVEEGVTWFAQVSPRQPRTAVVVLPPAAWVAAPIPLIAALIGLFAARRARWLWSDVVWCVACLFAKPLLLVREALLEPTAVAYWLMACVALVVPVAVAALVPRRLRGWLLLAIGVFGSLLMLADIVYYRFFGDVLSTPALLAVRQTPNVSGSIRSLFTIDLIWLLIDLPCAGWLVWRLARLRSPAPARRAVAFAATAAALALAGVPLSAPSALASAPLDQMFRDRAVVEQLGPFGFHLYDGWNFVRSTRLRAPVSDQQLQEIADWFASRAPLRQGVAPAFGAARGRNLIVIQVESLQDFVVDLRVGDQEVMPHLRRWTADSLRFTNVTDETNEGRTSDAEFTAMASLLPLDHGAAAFRYSANHYVGFPDVLAQHGYHTLSAVPFEAGFWNRRVMHPSYGFQRSFFEPDFQLTEQIGWGLDDYDFLQQMLPRLEQAPRPFAAWLITLSLHHPFDDFPDKHKVLKLGRLEGTGFGNYLHTMRFFDTALEAFRAGLAQRHLLDDSVLLVFGDHDAGFRHDPALAAAMGIGHDDVAWTLNDRVPVFMRIPDSGSVPNDQLRGSRSGIAGQTDLAPTLLALLGIDAAPLPYVGRNLLGRPAESPVPRPYGDWIDGRHLYFTRGGAPVCYDLANRRADDLARCDAGTAAVRRARQVSSMVIADDLQQRLESTMPTPR